MLSLWTESKLSVKVKRVKVFGFMDCFLANSAQGQPWQNVLRFLFFFFNKLFKHPDYKHDRHWVSVINETKTFFVDTEIRIFHVI